MQARRLDRAVDKLSPKLKDLQAAQDGTEINAWELERTIERARHLGDRRDAFERLRDFGRRALPRRHRPHVAAQDRFAHLAHLETHLRGDRRP